MNAKNDTGDCHSRCPHGASRMRDSLSLQVAASVAYPRVRMTCEEGSSWE